MMTTLNNLRGQGTGQRPAVPLESHQTCLQQGNANRGVGSNRGRQRTGNHRSRPARPGYGEGGIVLAGALNVPAPRDVDRWPTSRIGVSRRARVAPHRREAGGPYERPSVPPAEGARQESTHTQPAIRGRRV